MTVSKLDMMQQEYFYQAAAIMLSVVVKDYLYQDHYKRVSKSAGRWKRSSKTQHCAMNFKEEKKDINSQNIF